MAPIIDMTGKTFGRLKVVRLAYMRKEAIWECSCSCGRTAVVSGYLLRAGKTNSCGCLRAEIRPSLTRTHGASSLTSSPELRRTWMCWKGILSRCNNPNTRIYQHYGGRGITICDRWNNFQVFLSDMGLKPHGYTIGRIDNNAGYHKENCRWETMSEQANNRRSSRLLTIQGRTQSLMSWCAEYGIDRNTVTKRLKLGWPADLAITTPTRTRNTKD